MGDDWKGKFDHLREYCEVVYLPRTENVSTTLVIEAISKRGTTVVNSGARRSAR